MSKVQAYSSVSVVDLTDVGSINLYCTSNQPTTVIYDPNQSLYTPNWSSSHLVITPIISYNGTTLSRTATGLVITYTRKEGSGTATALTTGESVSGGVLTVSANKLASVTSGLLTYICNVTYTDPDTGVPISTEASISYSLVSMATEIHAASILGESVFLYDTNRTIVGPNQITLTADLTNVSVSQWQYKKSDGTFAAYPTTSGINASNTGSTLVVDESQSSIWINGKNAVIKLVTSDNSVYDLHEIVKIYDGAPGNSTVAAVLSNENHYLPCSANGTVKSWNGSATDIHIYEGGTDVTASWNITVTPGTGLTGSYDSATYTYTPSALTVDSSYADFTCTKTGYSNIVKRYTITKQTAGANGADAVIYEVIPDYYSLNLSEAGTFTPTSVVFTAYKKIGDQARANYSGRFIISESTDGSTFTNKYTSGSNEYTKTYTPSANNIVAIKCILYAAGGTSTQLDQQSVVVTKDGKKGSNGTNGTDGLSVGLANYSDVIPCNTSGNASAARDLNIPFYAYKGISRVAVTATPGTLPTGVTVKSNTAGTTSANGLLILTVASGATFGDSSLMSGDITITLAAESQSFDQKYSWTKSKQAANGENAVILQLYSEDGGYVQTGKDTTIKTMLTSGTSTVSTSDYSVVWKKFQSGSYQPISGQTSDSITITPAMVTDQMWLKCEVTYGGNTYSAYYTIDDATDPYTAYTYATISEFKNSQGYGAVYTRVYQNGKEVDPIKSTTFSNTAPSGASYGDFYYHLNPTSKTCVLKKYNGTSWADATETDSFTYKYYRIDNKGTSLDTTSAYKSSRCFYVDPSIINGRMQFICEISD